MRDRHLYTGGTSTALSNNDAVVQAEFLRLNKIIAALTNRVERSMSNDGSEFSVFQMAVMLDNEVQKRTRELEASLRENERINRALNDSQSQMAEEIRERKQIQETLEQQYAGQQTLIQQLGEAQSRLLQSEKLASIGQLAAGVAHEINNPIGFVNSNLSTLRTYVDNLLKLISAYENASPLIATDQEIQHQITVLRRTTDFDYMKEDIGSLIAESIDGTSRVSQIVQDLKYFSRVTESEWQTVDIHAGLDSTLNVIWNEIKYKSEIIKKYGKLPLVVCKSSQLNRVFMSLLLNAAQAITERGIITIRTGHMDDMVWISISDNGRGIAPDIMPHIFDPFFTTKLVGTGTGLGLSVSYGIISKMGGHIEVDSGPGQGATFTVWIPAGKLSS
ncbi:ATP-binding protein [Chitinimonas sp. BJB300]|uniref:ATP-binding protein n=2 Tax=Chitinimonas sp. BJB300 TaxID=1559339 RepID=UPI000C0D9057|nr:ATP-binding protein [Chitinimonas sp. BJB300]PHV11246.1 histidine kinase [Chitinimonas sp. BJB300]TSJ88608.1 histidine kinase [Chitinimonas sp. BJB300]